MSIRSIKTFSNCDATTIVWQASRPVAECRGFALERQTRGVKAIAVLPTWVGFKGEKHKSGEMKPSSVWPIQRYVWSDYGLTPGAVVRYRAIPMVGQAGKLKKADESEWSDWSNWTTLDTGSTAGFRAYFNRGIVASQWLARQKGNKTTLQKSIGDPGSKNRKMLTGYLCPAVIDLLKKASKDGVAVYAALYELNDPEVIDAFKKLGSDCNLILASGAYKGAKKNKSGKVTPAEPDENAAVRKDLRKSSTINLHDRLVKSPHFAHNKFIVFCDKDDNPVSVWTGSTNLTVTGLCTQVNNGIHIDSAELAKAYRERWEELKSAGSGYPASLAKAGSSPAKVKLGRVDVTAWNSPCLKLVDLEFANRLIRNAKQGVLFLFFKPGSSGTLLNTIMDLDSDKLFLHGVINEDPGGKKKPLLQVVHRGERLPARGFAAILPKQLKTPSNWFENTFQFSMVMIHSKVIVIDPFGKHPVVMTGSHNMGPKASKSNDDNLVIIENAPGLASEYAVNIMGVYGHYKWLYNQSLQGSVDSVKQLSKTAKGKARKASPKFDGISDDALWQAGYINPGRNKDEIDFWLGK